MKKINEENVNSREYWDEHIAEPKWGLRQEKYLELAGNGDKIIDIGCGLSSFIDRARENFKEAYGLDFSLKTIDKAERTFPSVNYIRSSVLSVPCEDKTFDVSVSGEVIEHIDHYEYMLEEMVRITKRRIIISTAKMEYNDPEHLWEFTKESLQKLGEKYGKTKVEEIKSDWFPGRSYLFMTIDLN
jgi:ubiquinone/menaquinone biosynthesis C-methylase UbiE